MAPCYTIARRCLQGLTIWLICQTTWAIVWVYHNYFPPQFSADFLIGRSDYFYGPYAVAFYAHILSGPVTLLAGLVLLSHRFRNRFPGAHRRIGRVQLVLVLGVLTPSGLAMAPYAATGSVAAAGFAALAIATFACGLQGWRTAVRREFDLHRRWMLRLYVLLCSAVVLRLIGGAAEMLSLTGTYPWAAWLSWLLPWLLLEGLRLIFPPSPHLQ